MKKSMILLFALLAACADKSTEATVKAVDGINGTTPVVSSCSVTEAEGGALVSCTDGTEAFIADGATGSSATASITNYTGSSCQLISGSSVYVKKSGSNFVLYSSSSCHASGKIYEVSQGEVYAISNNIIGIHATSVLKVLTFN
jgi:hypothetical protein